MNKNHLHDLIDEALTLQAQKGDLEAFYARHEEHREEIMALLGVAQVFSVLKNTTAPATLRDVSKSITARSQYILPAWHSWTSTSILMRSAAFAMLLIVVGSGFAYRQNNLRNEALASFDAVANDRQTFLDTVGTNPSIASSVTESDQARMFAVTAPSAAPPEASTLSEKTSPSSPAFEEAPALESTGIDAMYEEQSAIEALQQDSTAL